MSLHLSLSGHRPTYLGATTAVAPGLMIDNFLPIPYAESLPFYPSVLKLVVCVL